MLVLVTNSATGLYSVLIFLYKSMQYNVTDDKKHNCPILFLYSDLLASDFKNQYPT